MKNEIEKIDATPSTAQLARRGIAAAACTAGGALLFILQGIARLPVAGFIAGGIACAAGIVSLLSKDQADKKGGAVIGGAGALMLLSKINIPLLSAAAGTLLGIGAVGLLAAGIWNGIKFLRGLKKRS